MVEDASTEKPRRKWPSRHNVIMLLCCLVPLAIVAIFWNSVFAGDYLLLAVFLLCPLLHVFMMRGMHGKCDHDKKEL